MRRMKGVILHETGAAIACLDDVERILLVDRLTHHQLLDTIIEGRQAGPADPEDSDQIKS